MIKPTLHHVNLKTTRMQEMIDWYGVVVGTTVNLQSKNITFISNDRTHHRIALLAVPGLRNDPEKIEHTGIHHTAFEYNSFDDLMSSFTRLKQTGIEPETCLNHGMATSLYYSDPDQNLVELQVDNFGNWDASSEWMRTSEDFRQNPIGAFFDPAEFLKPTGPGPPSSNCKRTPTREYIPLRSHQTYICLRSADFPMVCGLLFGSVVMVQRAASGRRSCNKYQRVQGPTH
jgi:catechol 2,3-dioxygenase